MLTFLIFAFFCPQVITALKELNVAEYEKSKAKIVEPVVAVAHKSVSRVEDPVCSPVTGRPIRALAWKNKHLE